MSANNQDQGKNESSQLQTAEALEIRTLQRDALELETLRKLAADQADTIKHLQAGLRACVRSAGCDGSAANPSFVVATAISNKDREIRTLQLEIAELNKKIAHDAAMISSLEQTNSDLRDDVMAVRRCIFGSDRASLFDSRIGKSTAEIVKKRIDDLNAEVGSLQNQLTVTSEQNHEIRKLALKLHGLNESGKSTIQLLMDKLDEICCERNRLRSENTFLNNELAEINKLCAVDTHDVVGKSTKVIVQQKIGELYGYINNLKDSSKKLRNENRKDQEDHNALKNRLNSAVDELGQIRAFVSSMSSESGSRTIQLVREMHNTLTSEINTLRDRTESLKADLQDCVTNAGCKGRPVFVPASLVVAGAISKKNDEIKQLTDEVKKLSNELSLVKEVAGYPDVNISASKVANIAIDVRNDAIRKLSDFIKQKINDTTEGGEQASLDDAARGKDDHIRHLSYEVKRLHNELSLVNEVAGHPEASSPASEVVKSVIRDKDNEINRLSTLIKGKNSEIEELKSLNELLLARKNDQDQSIESDPSLEAEIDRLKTLLDRERKVRKSSNFDDEANKLVDFISQRMEGATKTIDEMTSLIKKKSSEIDNLKSLNEQLSKDIRGLDSVSELAATKQELRLVKRAAGYNEDGEDVGTGTAEIVLKAMSEKDAEIGGLKKTINIQNVRIDSLISEKSALESRCEHLTSGAWRQLDEETNRLRGSVDKVTRENTHLRSVMDSLRNVAKSRSEEISNLKSEIMKIRQDMDSQNGTQSAIDHQRGIINSLNSEIEQLHSVSRSQVETIRDLEKTILEQDAMIMRDNEIVKSELTDRVVKMMNDAFNQDKVAIHSLMVNRVPCSIDLGHRSEVLVETNPVIEGLYSYTVSAFGLIHGVMSALELPQIECRWKEGSRSMIMVGFQRKK